MKLHAFVLAEFVLLNFIVLLFNKILQI